MKRATPFVLTLLLSLGPTLQGQNLQTQPAPTIPTLQSGTPVRLRLSETLSSYSVIVGQTIEFEVLDNVKVGEVTVIAKGALAWGTVSEAQSSRSLGRGGKMDINIDSVRLVDGERVALRAVRNTKGSGNVVAMAGAVATSIVFPPAVFFLFMHGEDTTIPEGMEITAYINGDVPLDIPKFTRPPAEPALMFTANGLPIRRAAVRETSNQTVAEEDPSVVVEFTSVPTGADITIDGNYVGSTPSSVAIATGEHTISVSKPDYRSYERTMTVAPGHPRVAAYLEVQKAKVSISHHQ
ncbi:MAG TPA: PEGA domain-containing protein [Terriglobales bacterium]|jgi:hypothetical protein